MLKMKLRPLVYSAFVLAVLLLTSCREKRPKPTQYYPNDAVVMLH